MLTRQLLTANLDQRMQSGVAKSENLHLAPRRSPLALVGGKLRPSVELSQYKGPWFPVGNKENLSPRSGLVVRRMLDGLCAPLSCISRTTLSGCLCRTLAALDVLLPRVMRRCRFWKGGANVEHHRPNPSQESGKMFHIRLCDTFLAPTQ